MEVLNLNPAVKKAIISTTPKQHRTLTQKGGFLDAEIERY
jgi:hypothetical protein